MGADAFDRALHPLVAAAVHDDARAFPRERVRDGEADAGGRTGDEREFACELKIHG